MSRSASYDYEYERERRREIYLNRVRTTTYDFYERYYEQYQDMQSQGFQQYIPSEMSKLSYDLSQINYLIDSAPEAARDVSRHIGSYIRNMWYIGRSAANQFRQNDRENIAHQRVEEKHIFEKEIEEKQLATETADKIRLEHLSKLNDTYYQIVGEISDYIVANFAAPMFDEIKKEIQSGNSNITIAQLKERAAVIIENARQQAEEWKKNTVKSNKKQVNAARITEVKERLSTKKIEDKKKVEEIINRLDYLQSIESENDKLFDEELLKIEDTVDETLISEDVRRETVRAIYQQLINQEFIVDAPQLLEDEGYVLLTAHRFSGNRVICKIDLHGKLIYQFDKYEGSTCLKDIERFNVDLQQIYSIHLSDERVLWSNPDRLYEDANNINNPNKGGMNGGF